MSKFIKIDYFPRLWAEREQKYHYYKVNGKPASIFLSLNAIKSVNAEPYVWSLFENSDAARERPYVYHPVKLHRLVTDIAYGRGINGIDFDSYDITIESFDRLMKAIEVVE